MGSVCLCLRGDTVWQKQKQPKREQLPSEPRNVLPAMPPVVWTESPPASSIAVVGWKPTLGGRHQVKKVATGRYGEIRRYYIGSILCEMPNQAGDD